MIFWCKERCKEIIPSCPELTAPRHLGTHSLPSTLRCWITLLGCRCWNVSKEARRLNNREPTSLKGSEYVTEDFIFPSLLIYPFTVSGHKCFLIYSRWVSILTLILFLMVLLCLNCFAYLSVLWDTRHCARHCGLNHEHNRQRSLTSRSLQSKNKEL